MLAVLFCGMGYVNIMDCYWLLLLVLILYSIATVVVIMAGVVHSLCVNSCADIIE